MSVTSGTFCIVQLDLDDDSFAIFKQPVSSIKINLNHRSKINLIKSNGQWYCVSMMLFNTTEFKIENTINSDKTFPTNVDDFIK